MDIRGMELYATLCHANEDATGPSRVVGNRLQGTADLLQTFLSVCTAFSNQW